MYTNETNAKFSFRDIVLQFLFIALAIFLLLWLFPMKSDFKKLENSVDKLANGSLKLSSNSKGELNLAVLYDRIFNENVIAMKEAAKAYYTTPRLPQKVGETSKITLEEMLSKKIILPFVDKNGKACDTKGSYVEVTKYKDEFVMKVNLKCSDQENYLLVYMGCYDYCHTAICEKNKADIKTPVVHPAKKVTTKTTPQPTPQPTPSKPATPSCSLAVASGKLGSDGYYKSDVVIKFASKQAGGKATLKGYGLGLNENYNGANTYTVSSDGTTTVYGYVKNSDNQTARCSITVKKKIDTIKPVIKNPTCELQVVSGQKNSNGTYKTDVVVGFKSKTANTKGATIVGYGLAKQNKASYNGATKYVVSSYGSTTIYGFVKDSNGNTGKCNITVVKEKEQSCTWSAWSKWSDTKYTPSATRKVRYQTLLIGYKVKKEKDTTKPIFETKKVVIGTTTIKSCTKYNYSGSITYSEWQLVGTVKKTSAPTNSTNVKYVYVGTYDWYCTSSSNCTAGTVMVYKMYKKNITSSKGSYTCSKWATDTQATVANKTILTGYETKTTKTPVYKTQYSYSDCR